MTETYTKVVGIRFGRVSKIDIYDANGYDLQVDDHVIVETTRGRQIGTVAQVLDQYVTENDNLKSVERVATPRELVLHELYNERKNEVVEYTKNRAKELNIKGIKVLDAEFSYDGTRLLVNYASCNDEKLDVKTLKYDIQRSFQGVSIVDLRQLGPRDVAKTISGMGACGLACRCCSRYLTEFNSISIKMAKEQGISLTPTEITGMCGRLRCCLVYENDYYVECRKKLPKKNKRVMTPQGEGKVLEVFPMRDAVLVDVPETGRREYTRDQITWDISNPSTAATPVTANTDKDTDKDTETDTTQEETNEIKQDESIN